MSSKSFNLTDGSTLAPTVYSGEIGRKISGKKGLIREDMVNFVPVKGIVPNVIDEELLQNQDIKNLFYLCNLIQTGPSASKKLLKSFKCIPGVVTASRWVTTANNLLCLYAQESNPSENLVLLVRIILNIYAPLIFGIKKDWHITRAPIHFFNALKLSRDLLLVQHPHLFQVVIKVLQNNPYNAHHEAILPAMLFHSELKQKAMEKIQELREAEKKSKKVRQYQKPLLNFNAEHFTELLDFNSFNSSPPLLQDYSLDQIASLDFGEDFNKLTSNSQNVERVVYLVSLAAQYAIGYTNCHHYMINKEINAAKIPTDFTKKHFIDILQKQPNH